MSVDRPSCFGIAEKCMPRDENGIIQPQEKCRACEHLRDCLRAALAASGQRLPPRAGQSASAARAEEPRGIVGALLRWSARKRAAQKGGSF